MSRFAPEPNLNTFFGITRGVEAGGTAFNIRLASSILHQNGDLEKKKQLSLQTGLISSSLEHLVPEQIYSDPDDPTDAVSAVKALQLADIEGQKIYQIDSDNINLALTDINLGYEVEEEIRRAIGQGRIVITHQTNISVPGWTGAGYIILDPETNVGSYKISGGANGGFIKDTLSKLDSIISFLYDQFIDKIGGKLVQVIKKIKGKFESIINNINFLLDCGFLKGAVGILSIFLFSAGIGFLASIFSAIATSAGGVAGVVISLTSLYLAAVAIDEFSSAWGDSCQK